MCVRAVLLCLSVQVAARIRLLVIMSRPPERPAHPNTAKYTCLVDQRIAIVCWSSSCTQVECECALKWWVVSCASSLRHCRCRFCFLVFAPHRCGDVPLPPACCQVNVTLSSNVAMSPHCPCVCCDCGGNVDGCRGDLRGLRCGRGAVKSGIVDDVVDD